MCLALLGDWWLVGGAFGGVAGLPAATAGAIVMLAASGLATAFRPGWVLGTALAAGAASVISTATATGADGRFVLFVDLVVGPFVIVVLVLRGGVWSSVLAVMVSGAGLTVGLRPENATVAAVVTIAMAVALATAVAGAASLRSAERTRRVSVELARQAERLELAREIHDVVAHHVTGIVVLAQAHRSMADDTSPADDALLMIEEAGHRTMRSIRHLVGSLRDDHAELETWTDIDEFVSETQVTSPRVELVVDDRVGGLEPTVATATALRVLREAVTNARRHGCPDGRITGSITRTTFGIDIEVTNDGDPTDRGDGFGLVGLSERVTAAGGDFHAGPVGPHGWRLSASIPHDQECR